MDVLMVNAHCHMLRGTGRIEVDAMSILHLLNTFLRMGFTETQVRDDPRMVSSHSCLAGIARRVPRADRVCPGGGRWIPNFSQRGRPCGVEVVGPVPVSIRRHCDAYRDVCPQYRRWKRIGFVADHHPHVGAHHWRTILTFFLTHDRSSPRDRCLAHRLKTIRLSAHASADKGLCR